MDSKNRLLISVWSKGTNGAMHHDENELLGCMSFGIKNMCSKIKVSESEIYYNDKNKGCQTISEPC